MNFSVFLRFLSDQLLIVLFFFQIPSNHNRPIIKRIASYLCLFPLLLLMRQGSPAETIWRIVLRIACYSTFLFFNKDISLDESLFCGIYGTLCFTTAQIFIGFPLLNSLNNPSFAWAQKFAVIYQASSAFLIKAVVLLPFYFQKPLSGKISMNRISFYSLILVLICQTYLKFNSSNISETGLYARSDMVIYSALLQLFLLAFATLIIKYMNIMEKEHENELLNLADKQHLHYLRSRLEQDGEIQKLHHDMKNQLLAVQQTSDTDKKKENISDLLHELDSFEVVVNTGNSLIDALIASKIKEARKNDIHISVILDLKEISFIKDVDLIRIIGNALDNALEATISSDKNKAIKIVSEKAANFYIIHVINPYAGEKTFVDGLPLTTKEDKKIHGMGLKNIRKCVEKYDGELHISTKDNTFHLTMMFPLS